MDLIEYAKWGIRVKEEPGTLGQFHLDKESNENNFGELQGGWMCKFPCDAQGALDTAVTNSQYALLEPFEMPSANHLEEQNEYFNLEGSDKFTDSTLAEGNNNISLKHSSRISQQDGSTKNHAVLHNPLEENIVTSFSNSRETLKINVSPEEKQILNQMLNVRCDISEDLASRANFTNRREYVEGLSKKSDFERSNEIDFITENQNVIVHSEVKQLYDSQENGVATGAKNRGTLESSLNVENSICRESESSSGEFIERAEQQNSQKANNNEFRISDITTFECPDCSEVLRNFNGFILHMNSHIMQEHLDVDSVQCKNCKRKFDDKKSLSFHQKACEYAKESSLIPSANKPNSNSICLTVNYPGENSPTSNDQYALKENLEFDLSSQCQEMSQNFNEQQTCQPQDLTFNPKRRQQTNSEECSSSDPAESRNSWTKQKLGAADDAFDVSWSSEIKCREEREGKNSSSVRTLSLRLFRFRRPRVVVKRTQVPVRSESVIKTFNSDLEDSCSSNEKALFQEGKVGCNTLKQLIKEPVINKGNKMSKCDSNDMSCTNILKPYPKQKHVLDSQKNWCYARQRKSADTEKCNLQTNTTGVQYIDSPLVSEAKISEVDKISNELCVDASNEFPPKDVNVRSNLKIKIKPVVVLDRLSPLNLNYSSNKPSKESTSTFVGDISTENNLPRGINFHMNSNFSEKCKDKPKNDAKTFVVQSARHHDLHCNRIKCTENGILLSDLEKRYCLKKCYVKLKRISVEPCSLKTIGKRNYNNEETGNEVKTCGKIKLRRMSSKLWAVSSCSSPSETIEVTECSEDCMKTAEQICVTKNTEYSNKEYSSDVVMQAEMNDQKFKKSFGNHESKSSSPSFSEASEETLQKHAMRGKRVKCFKSKCTCCQKRFFDEQELDQHLETHFSGFKCPNCSARFHFVMELHAHIAGCSLASLLDCHKAPSQIKQCQVVL